MSILGIDLRIPRAMFDVVATFDVVSGTALALVGPNGAGKSTVLSAIAGLTPATGSLTLDGREISAEPAESRAVGVVFQDFLLFPHLTVRDNVAFSLRVRGAAKADAREAVEPWLSRFDLSELSDRYPAQLSGGQAQRVALARALASEPAVLMLDEPMAALDVEIRDEVRADLAGYIRQFGGPTIVVTHDVEDARSLSAEVAVIESGSIVQRGTLAALAAAPASPWVDRFAGRSR